MNDIDKAELRKEQNCPYSSCDKCEIQFCPAKTNVDYESYLFDRLTSHSLF